MFANLSMFVCMWVGRSLCMYVCVYVCLDMANVVFTSSMTSLLSKVYFEILTGKDVILRDSTAYWFLDALQAGSLDESLAPFPSRIEIKQSGVTYRLSRHSKCACYAGRKEYSIQIKPNKPKLKQHYIE